MLYDLALFCEISSSHSGITEDSSPLGCEPVSLDPLFPGVSMDRIYFIFTVKQSKTRRHIREDLGL